MAETNRGTASAERSSTPRRVRDAKILALKAGGVPEVAIAASLDIAAATVARVCKRGKVDLSSEDIKERNQRAVELRLEGASLAAIAAQLGLSEAWISHILRSAGVRGRRKQHRDQEILRLGLAGHPMKEIGEVFGISQLAAGKAFERAGGPRARKDRRNIQLSQARALHRRGMSNPDIATKLGTSSAAVARMLKR